MKRRVILLLVLALATGFAGCGSGGAGNTDPILRLSASESLAEGKKLLADEKYSKARRYLSHAFEVEPNSVSGREALLLVADTYYLEGGNRNYIESESKYRDFLNRFPTSDQAAYAQLQIANSLAKRMERPDRDQSSTLKSLEAYEDLLRLYPTSEYAAQAREQMHLVRENLARHEFLIGRFNFKYRNYRGAIERFEYILSNYPGYSDKDEVLYYLGLSYRRSRRKEDHAKAAGFFDQLRTQFPNSPYVAQIPAESPDGEVSP